jgi:hypothetical protein
VVSLFAEYDDPTTAISFTSSEPDAERVGRHESIQWTTFGRNLQTKLFVNYKLKMCMAFLHIFSAMKFKKYSRYVFMKIRPKLKDKKIVRKLFVRSHKIHKIDIRLVDFPPF